MRKTVVSLVLIGLLAISSASAGASSVDALASLKRAHPRGVIWDVGGAKTADITCDGQEDLIILGKMGQSVLVSVIPSVSEPSPGKPIVQEFSLGQGGYQDAFCGTTVRVRLEPRYCVTGDDVPLDGCKPVKGCRAFRVEDGACDSFHFFWNNRHKTVEWWRL